MRSYIVERIMGWRRKRSNLPGRAHIGKKITMAVPTYEEIMPPTLAVLNKCDKYVSSKELDAETIEVFDLNAEERAERTPSGNSNLYKNNANWARQYLKHAGLIDFGYQHGGKRGTYRATDAGRAFQAEHPEGFGVEDLLVFPTFSEYYGGKHGGGDRQPMPKSTEESEQLTPPEIMEKAAKEIRDALAEELLQVVASMDDYDFEFLVAKLLVAMGYGQSLDEPTTVTPKSNDGGIDGIVKEDRLGFDNVYFQAKRWDKDTTVTKPEVQKFSGALNGQHANKGLFITTARFSEGARKYVETVSGQRIVLVDGVTLAHLMIDYNVGVTEEKTYVIKSVDTDFFEG